MAGEWQTLTLEESMAAIIDYRGKTPLKVSSGIPLITAKVVKGGRIDTPNEFIAEDDYVEWMRRGLPQRGDVVLTTEAPLGEVAQLANERVALAQRLICLRGKPELLDNDFLKFLMQSRAVQHQLHARASGTTVLGIKQSELRKIQLILPSLDEQRAIAHILGTLDNKIELNRRMSDTLKAIVRELFNSWFIDFDPVRARSEGRDPDIPAPLAGLFPARLVDSELGETPEGWRVSTLSEHCDAIKGVSYKGSGLGDDGMPLHNLNSVYEGGGYKYEGIKYYSGDYAERHVVSPGDVIVANTEQGHDRLLIGYAAIVPASFGGRGIASHHLYRLRPRPGSPLTPSFLCWLLNSPHMHDVVSGYTNGTTVNMLPVDGVQKPLVVWPPKALVAAFDSIAVNAELRRDEMFSESRTLSALRDSLLTKLISGELLVTDAEKFIGKVI
jgi:type I restriction enzyme, S subunit